MRKVVREDADVGGVFRKWFHTERGAPLKLLVIHYFFQRRLMLDLKTVRQLADEERAGFER